MRDREGHRVGRIERCKGWGGREGGLIKPLQPTLHCCGSWRSATQAVYPLGENTHTHARYAKKILLASMVYRCAVLVRVSETRAKTLKPRIVQFKTQPCYVSKDTVLHKCAYLPHANGNDPRGQSPALCISKTPISGIQRHRVFQTHPQ